MNLSLVMVKGRTFWTQAGHVGEMFSLLLERIIKKFMTLHVKIKFKFWPYIEYKAVNSINCRVLSKVAPYTRLKNSRNFHMFYLFFTTTNVTFTSNMSIAEDGMLSMIFKMCLGDVILTSPTLPWQSHNKHTIINTKSLKNHQSGNQNQ